MPGWRAISGCTLFGTSLLALMACSDDSGPELTDPRLFVAVSAGAYHTCGITAGESLFCWGRNDYDQLGDTVWTDSYGRHRNGSAIDRGIATPVAVLPVATTVSCRVAAHVCRRS